MLERALYERLPGGVLVLTHHTARLGAQPDCWGHSASFRPYCVLSFWPSIGPVCAVAQAPLCLRGEEGRGGTLKAFTNNTCHTESTQKMSPSVMETK